jgi:iron(II)-dependent oxidoreductase
MLTSTSTVSHDLLARMSEARDRSDALFRLVREDSLYDRPIPERHRIIFYVGHLEAFDWNLLQKSLGGSRTASPEFDRLFACGIDPVGGGLPDDKPSDWPALATVRDYVKRTRSSLDGKLADAHLESPSADPDFPIATLLDVAIEHRLMHLETLAYMLHQLPLDRKIPQQSIPIPADQAAKSSMQQIPAGPTTLGLRRNGDEFGWDNEFEAHTRHVSDYQIDQFKVTNQQFLDFIQAGGYRARELWTEDDWNWITASGISHPVFWEPQGNQWLYRAMFQEIPLPRDWPVYVSHAEASAYARWVGKSLPSEEQWHRAAYGTPEEGERYYPWGNTAPSTKLGNFDFVSWDPAPVTAFEHRSAFGVHGMLGNGWEWTSSIFAPFPNFSPFPFYPGYSANFFDGKHFVMKGGSARTAACMLRPSFRNWFQAHYQYVYAGFRCVKP